MCGIIGYSGAEYAREKLLHGLENLEYRGYDSAGIALWDEGKIEVIKAAGRLSNLLPSSDFCPDRNSYPASSENLLRPNPRAIFALAPSAVCRALSP